MPEIGIVILNYNTWEDTARCVESIRDNPPQVSYEIILVDNASTVPKNGEIDDLIRRHELIYIENEKNVGYNGGNNIGVRKALELGCSGIIIANSDVCFSRGCIESLRQYAASHPDVGIVGPKILDNNGNVQRSNLCRRTGMKEKYLVRTRLHAVFRRAHRSYFGFDRDYDSTFSVYAVLGCCFYITRSCAEAVTPFDDYPFLYEEELILGIHMEEKGFATVYHGAAQVRHIHGASTRRVKPFSYAHNIRSEIYYCRRYLRAKRWQIMPLYCYRVLLYLARCFCYRDFRSFFGKFIKMTWEELDKC